MHSDPLQGRSFLSVPLQILYEVEVFCLLSSWSTSVGLGPAPPYWSQSFLHLNQETFVTPHCNTNTLNQHESLNTFPTTFGKMFKIFFSKFEDFSHVPFILRNSALMKGSNFNGKLCENSSSLFISQSITSLWFCTTNFSWNMKTSIKLFTIHTRD